MGKTKVIYAKDCKCNKCGRSAVAFWPNIDPDIPRKPWCRKCLDEAKFKVMQRLTKKHG